MKHFLKFVMRLVLIVALGTLFLVQTLASPVFGGSYAPKSLVGPSDHIARNHLVIKEPALAPDARVVGVPPMIRVDITLKLSHPVLAARFAYEVSDPKSSLFRHFLAKGQFNQDFGPSPGEVHRVQGELASLGLSTSVQPVGYVLQAYAPTKTIDHAFHTRVDSFMMPGNRIAHSNISPVYLPSNISSDVMTITGLSNVSQAVPQGIPTQSVSQGVLSPSLKQPYSKARLATGGPQPCQSAVNTGALTADQLASAYSFSGAYQAGFEGQGETIALVELGSGWNPNDISAYESCYGINNDIYYVDVDGANYETMNSGSVEPTLDIEDAVSLAPQAKIITYETPNSSTLSEQDALSAIASNDSSQIVSISYGGCEDPYGDQSINTILEQLASQGNSIFAASGDTGANCSDITSNGTTYSLGVSFPASSPYVTGVGGTQMSSVGPPPVESTWNDGTGSNGVIAASGGGCSKEFYQPQFQANYFGDTYPNSTYCREVPDVSALAGSPGYSIYYTGPSYTGPSGYGTIIGWQIGGGTSAASPLWAALLAVSNSDCNRDFGPINPSIYKYSSQYLNDVTSGNNGYYYAGVGYDLTTGLGSPNGSAFMCTVGSPTATTTTTSTTLPPTTTTTTTSTTSPIINIPTTTSTTLSPTTTTTSTTLPPTTTTVAPTTTLPATTTAAPPQNPVPKNNQPGYWLLGSDGSVYSFGSANFYGSASALGPASAMAATADGGGYWLASSNGAIQAFGDAIDYPLSAFPTTSVVAIASTRDGNGFWLATSGGQVIEAGDAQAYGSPALQGISLTAPIVAMAVTKSGDGYWLVAADGGVFAFGDAGFVGSSGQINPGFAAGGSNSFVPNKPIIGIVATVDGGGYWMVGADGGVFAFGDAGFVGSSGQINPALPAGGSNSFVPNKPIIGIVASADGGGYWMVGADGGVFAFGDAGFVGSLGNNPPANPIVAIVGD